MSLRWRIVTLALVCDRLNVSLESTVEYSFVTNIIRIICISFHQKLRGVDVANRVRFCVRVQEQLQIDSNFCLMLIADHWLRQSGHRR
ncbi:hypothetical protein WH47_00653 [Habropoda laboriosa]|uniref:Secreted protein n=1 Tax=Habropoda laboriosa TaxID=597456 RepID=A0A0L7RI86_9HYME|nr:hypothetical protein WH47_00653 [Habropoda laboriosa]